MNTRIIFHLQRYGLLLTIVQNFQRFYEYRICDIKECRHIKADHYATFKVTLQDRLACSGCAITMDEITINSFQNTSKIFEKLGEVHDYIVLVGNLAAVRNWSGEKAYASIV